jgi:hypothetical protein
MLAPLSLTAEGYSVRLYARKAQVANAVVTTVAATR